MTWANIGDPASNNPGRTELVRYDSPAYHGFIYSASVAEAGDYWGTMLRYANEFNGVRLAGTVGYERVTDVATPTTRRSDGRDLHRAGSRTSRFGAFALSAMHVPTGLFVQGHYNHADFNSPFNRPAAASPVIGAAATVRQESRHPVADPGWYLEELVRSGNTSIYGEYGMDDWGACGRFGNRDSCRYIPPLCGRTLDFTVNGVIDTEMRVWGLGIVQKFDAAATDVYLGYRHFDADITCHGAATPKVRCAGAAGGTANKLPTEGIDVIVGGARVLF